MKRIASSSSGASAADTSHPYDPMSLTTLHLIFISTSIALAFGCGLYWLSEFVSGSSGLLGLLSAVVAGAIGIALILYERYAAKKFHKLLGSGSHHR